MKKLLISSALVTMVGLIYLNSRTEKGIPERKVQTSSSVTTVAVAPVEKVSQAEAPAVLSTVEVEQVLDQVVSVDELEDSFSKMSDQEIEKEIAKNLAEMEQSGLIKIANTQGLDEVSAKKLLAYVRVNTALNKIRLTRHLDEMENKYEL